MTYDEIKEAWHEHLQENELDPEEFSRSEYLEAYRLIDMMKQGLTSNRLNDRQWMVLDKFLSRFEDIPMEHPTLEEIKKYVKYADKVQLTPIAEQDTGGVERLLSIINDGLPLCRLSESQVTILFNHFYER